MKEWNRSSRECTLKSLQPRVADAIQKHIEYYHLGPVLEDTLMCIETSSTRIKKGLFSRNDDHGVAVTAVITPCWLIWGIDEKTVQVRSIKLQDLVVVDYKDTPGYKLIQDTGIELTGPFTGWVSTDGNPNLSYLIGLGEEPAAAKFKETLIRSVQDAKRK